MFTPVTYRGDDNFQRMLKDLNCLYFVEEVKAFILGAVLSSDSLTPSEALDFLIKDEEGEDLVFQTTEEYTEFISQFFALWNQIAELINTDQVPPLSFYPLHFENDEERLSAAAVRANEIKLFLTSLSDGTDFDEIKDKNTQDLLFYFEHLAESMHNTVVRLNDKIEEEDLGLIETMLEDSDAAWWNHFAELKSVLLNIRKAHLAKEKPTLIHADFSKKTRMPARPPLTQ